MRNLLLEIKYLLISKIPHPFFSKGYELSFLKNDANWKKISFEKLLQGMTVKVNGTDIEPYYSTFPNRDDFVPC